MFEVFDHTADIGLRVRAATLEQLIAEAARGLFSLLVANLDDVRPVNVERFEITGDEPDYLLFDSLNELLFAFATRGQLFVRFDVERTATGLIVVAHGESVDRSRHRLDHEVKAITYHELCCEQTSTGWQAEFILDI